MPSRIQILRCQALDRQHGRCWYCCVQMWSTSPHELERPGALSTAAQLRCTAEHLVAQRDGGGDTAHNIVAACVRCNGTRHKRKPPSQLEAYREEVRTRIARGAWHPRWVYEQQLLQMPAKQQRRTTPMLARPAR